MIPAATASRYPTTAPAGPASLRGLASRARSFAAALPAAALSLAAGWPARCLLLLVAAAIRIPALAAESFWRDEVDAVLFASVPWPELLAAFTLPQHNGPAYHVALRIWTDAVGVSELAVRYFAFAGDLVALSVVVALARRFGRGAAAGAGVLWALMPAALWYARDAKMYSWLAALAAACLYLSVAGLERRSFARAAAAPALAAAGVYLHFFAALLVAPAAAGALIAAWDRRRVRRLARFRAAAAIALAALALVVGRDVVARELGTLLSPPVSGHPFVPLGELFPRILFGLTLNSPPLPGVLPAAVLLFPLLAGLLALPGESRSRALRGAGVLGLYLVLPIALFYVVSLRLPLFAERYFVILLPALVVLLARGLVVAMARAPALAVPAAVLLLVLLASVSAQQLESRTKPDYRAAAAHIRALSRPGDAVMVVMPYNLRSVGFYLGDAVEPLAPPSVWPGVADAELEAQAGGALDGRRRLWLVRAEADQYDPDGAIARWLAARAHHAQTRAWPGVSVDLYERRP